MYCVTELDEQSESWFDVLLERDWSMLEGLILGNYGNTKCVVKSQMTPSKHFAT